MRIVKTTPPPRVGSSRQPMMLTLKSSGPVETGFGVATGKVAVGVSVAVAVGVALAAATGVVVGGWRVGIASVLGAIGGIVASTVAVIPIGCSPPVGAVGVAELASEHASKVIDNSSKPNNINQRGFINRLL
jgi:hypothetical protein